MEVYYKDLISEDASLEKLVGDLMVVVQGVDELAQAAQAGLLEPEIQTRLQRLKENCLRAKDHAVQAALATDKMMRRHPYPSIGVIFGCGLLAGLLVSRARR